jgi:hypothetical protein
VGGQHKGVGNDGNAGFHQPKIVILNGQVG